MMRSLLLYLADSTIVRDCLMRFGFSRRTALRFVAGENPQDAIRVVSELNRLGIAATVNCLGENIVTEADSRRAADVYLPLLDQIRDLKLRCGISLKLTHLGLDISQNLCLENVERIVRRAGEDGCFVRLDMEGSAYTDRTLDVFRSVRQNHDNIGVVIQAYLYRSQADLAELIQWGANVRLCKGAYKEPPSIAYPRKADVDRNYMALAELLFSQEARDNGAYPAIATHDERLIAWVKGYTADHGIARGDFEFQMLYGIRRDLQQRLADEGYQVRVYVPFGAEWYPYFMRRLAERPANLWFLLRNVLR